ncbi:MAG TPA: FliM/FliN family flagellar motor C-terminal domain-containing protein [Polyangiales bacterium]
MPHLEAPVESSLSPARDPLAAFLPWLELRELLRKTAQIDEVSSAFGWPRALDAGLVQRWFSGPQVVCTLAHASDLDVGLTWLTLPVDQAVALVDLCLGGSGKPSVACQAGAPSDAECGVLAYLASRCVRICAPALRVRDVAAHAAAALTTWPHDTWLWPIRLQLGDMTSLELALLGSTSSALARQGVAAELSLADDLAPAALNALTPGDLLVWESWPAQFTHAGLSGALELIAPALQMSLPVALEAGQVRALRGSSTAPRPPLPQTAQRPSLPLTTQRRARLVLGHVQASLRELAELASGLRRLPVVDARPARLELDGVAIASGKLVRHGGALALEIEALSSMR